MRILLPQNAAVHEASLPRAAPNRAVRLAAGIRAMKQKAPPDRSGGAVKLRGDSSEFPVEYAAKGVVVHAVDFDRGTLNVVFALGRAEVLVADAHRHGLAQQVAEAGDGLPGEH